MTRPLRIALYALALLLMVPALLMAADAWSWLVIGHTMTGHDWFAEDRIGGALLLLTLAILVASLAERD